MQSPQVAFKNGELRILADRADLGELLARVSGLGGMKVEGQPHTDPISGVYGPGKPRVVLTRLLESSRCNYVMVGGTADEMPRELVLSSRSRDSGPQDASAKPGAAESRAGYQAVPAQQRDAVESSPGAEAAGEPASLEPLGPGAIAHVPPNEAEDAGAPQQDAGARMQQHLERLQQLQQQQGAPQ